MIVKVFQTTQNDVANIKSLDGTIQFNCVLDDRLRNKMNRRARAYFEADYTPEGELRLKKRLPNQKW